MELGSIFLILAVAVLIGMYLYAPFMARLRRGGAAETLEVSALKAERDRVINALQELDFDQTLGKIPAEEYPPQRAALLQKGAEVLRRLDELTAAAAASDSAEARIEEAAAAVRADSSATIKPVDDEDIEALIASRRRESKARPAGFCPKCGKPVLAADKFCASCGKSL